ALVATTAERAFVVERAPAGGVRVLESASARGRVERAEVSRAICARGFEGGQPLSTSHAERDERLGASESVQTLALRSVAFVPMPVGEATLGLYVEDRARPAAFGEEELAL